MTQRTLFGNDERLMSSGDILRAAAKAIPDGVPDEKWRSVVMYSALFSYPDFISLIMAIPDVAKWVGGSKWPETIRKAFIDKAQTADIPSFETLTRQLREIQKEFGRDQKTSDRFADDAEKNGYLSKTLR